jgi:tellurite resistance protein TehA-like permease
MLMGLISIVNTLASAYFLALNLENHHYGMALANLVLFIFNAYLCFLKLAKR